jgi:DNA segregation ATPase FtsK/SpoIIIE-like protein
MQTNDEGIYELPSPLNRREDAEPVPYGQISFEYADSLFEDAARFVVTQQNAQISTLQRNFRIGLNRAGRLRDMLVEAGSVALSKDSSQNEVLIASETALTQHVAQLKGTMAQQFITAETGKKMVAKPAYDSMLEEVACSIVEYQASFVSFIQRKFALGYDRASSIMNQLESLGIVSSSTGGARELLITDINEIKKLIDDSEKP